LCFARGLCLLDGLVLTHGEAAPGRVRRWAEKNAQEAALALGPLGSLPNADEAGPLEPPDQ
jgi:hypothetical protein